MVCFEKAVMVVKRYNNLLHYRRRPRPGSNHVLGKHGYVTTRSTSPGHSEANLRYHDAQTGAHGQKLAAASHFVRPVLKKL